EAARAAGRQAGVEKYMVHRSGHGLGLEHHEPPFLTYDNELLLQPGMVFSVEPGVYVPGIGGFRHSDSVLATETGYEVLTEGPKGLADVILRRHGAGAPRRVPCGAAAGARGGRRARSGCLENLESQMMEGVDGRSPSPCTGVVPWGGRAAKRSRR